MYRANYFLGNCKLISDIIHATNIFDKFFVIVLESLGSLAGHGLVLVHLTFCLDERVNALLMLFHLEQRTTGLLLLELCLFCPFIELLFVVTQLFFEQVYFVFHLCVPIHRVLYLHSIELKYM